MERVSRSSQTFNYNVIDAVVGVVLDVLAETLAEGYIVELGELGHFSISLEVRKCTLSKQIDSARISRLVITLCALPKSSKGRLSVK